MNEDEAARLRQQNAVLTEGLQWLVAYAAASEIWLEEASCEQAAVQSASLLVTLREHFEKSGMTKLLETQKQILRPTIKQEIERRELPAGPTAFDRLRDATRFLDDHKN